MIKTAIKFALVCALVLVFYKGLEVYALLRFGEHIGNCEIKSRVCPLIERRADSQAIGAAMNETLSCVASKQSFFESIVLPVRKQLTVPSGESIDYGQPGVLCKQ